MTAQADLLDILGLALIAVIGYVVVGWLYDRVTKGDTQSAGDSLCPDATCRHFNQPDAEFCARCGRRLP